jgi:hypothetical protein
MEKKLLPLFIVAIAIIILLAVLIIYLTNTNQPAALSLTPISTLANEPHSIEISSTPEDGTAVPQPTATLEHMTTPLPTATTTASPSAAPAFTPTVANTATAVTSIPPTDAIIVNHESVALFDQIPDEYLEAAADLHMLYIDESVGFNINIALDCLRFATNEEAPHHCSDSDHVVPAFSTDPSEVSWSRAGGYDRSNWLFLTWQEGNDCNRWQDKARCFLEMIDPIINEYDVLSFQFSYLAVTEDSKIADQPGGYFSDNPDDYDVFDHEAYEAQHPDKIIIYWTTSLARSIGSEVSDTFNEQMRQYAIANSKPLFDVADILSHDPAGNPCYDDRDGLAYDNGNQAENYPDDGVDHLAICQHYTTEVNGGHLGSVSTGAIRVAKAFWVLMARLAGWNGIPEP